MIHHQTPSLSIGQADPPNDPIRSLREKRDDEELRDHHFLFLAIACVLLAVLVGAIWYEYPVLARHKADLMRLPGLVQSVDAIGSRVNETDAKLADWSRQRDLDREAIDAQMSKLARDMHTGVAAARKHASDAADAVYARIEAQVGPQIDAVETRLAKLETGRQADQKQLAALQQELASVHQDLSQQTGKIAALENQIAQNGTSTGTQIADLQREQTRSRQDVDTISNQLAVDKVPFEAEKGRDHELANGISLHVTKTDLSRGRFDGWMALNRGQRSILLRHQSIHEPLDFYGPEDGKKCELVFTSVNRNSVTGYLLLPKGAAGQVPSGE